MSARSLFLIILLLEELYDLLKTGGNEDRDENTPHDQKDL